MSNENINKRIRKNERIREIALMLLPTVTRSRLEDDSAGCCVRFAFVAAEDFVNKCDSLYPID